MSLRFIWLFFTLFTAAVSHGALPEAVEATVSADYVSSYVFRGDKIAGASIQPSVNLTFGAVYATVWGSRESSGDKLNETDFTVGFTSESLHLDGGLTAYTYEGAKSSWEPYLGFSGDAGADVKASLYAYYDWILHVTTFEGKLTHSLELTKRFSVDTGIAVGNAQGREISFYQYWSAGITPRFAITSKLSANASASYRSVSSSDHSRDVMVYTAGLSFSF